jgi:multiple sugar transport system permease protein
MVTEVILESQSQNQQSRKQRTRHQRRTATFFLLVSPWLIGFVFLGIVPFIIGLLTSFTNYDGLNISNFKFVGFANYLRSMEDLEVAFSAKRTLLWGAVNLPTWLLLSFGLAVILNQNVKGRGIFRTVFYIPSLIPIAAAVTAWRVILERNFGMLNHLISQLTPEPVAIGWFSDYALPGMTGIAVWGGLGSGMVIFLAGLQGIPNELLEAAKIDGANQWKSFRHVTLPLMTPVIFFQLVMGLIGAFQQLNLPMIMTGVAMTSTSVPPRAIYLYMIHTYRQIFTFGRFGYGTALLWMLFIAIVVLTAFVFWSEKYWVYSGDEIEGGS